MAGVLALALAAAPLPAMAMEDDRTDESVLAVPATASGEAAGEKTGADANADEEATQTVTIYHFELVHYDDPTLEDWGVPELTGTRLLGTTTVEGLKPGDVVKAWDHVGTNPGFAFFDGWPRELTVSEDPSKNAIRLNYFRQSSDVTVNYYEASLLDASGSMPLYNHTVVETIGDHTVGFTKMGSEVRSNELFADVLTGDELTEATEPVDGLAYVGSYPEDVFVNMDSSKTRSTSSTRVLWCDPMRLKWEPNRPRRPTIRTRARRLVILSRRRLRMQRPTGPPTASRAMGTARRGRRAAPRAAVRTRASRTRERLPTAAAKAPK